MEYRSTGVLVKPNNKSLAAFLWFFHFSTIPFFHHSNIPSFSSVFSLLSSSSIIPFFHYSLRLFCFLSPVFCLLYSFPCIPWHGIAVGDAGCLLRIIPTFHYSFFLFCLLSPVFCILALSQRSFFRRQRRVLLQVLQPVEAVDISLCAGGKDIRVSSFS